MKKILIILIAIPLIFNSCEKEDENTNDTSGSILGTWKVENYTRTWTEGYIDPVLGTEVVTNTEVSTGPGDVEEYITFRYDNTLLTHLYNNDTLLDVATINYTKNGNEIILEFGVVLTITQLTNTNLRYNVLNPGGTHSPGNDTTYFDSRLVGWCNLTKSVLPSITNVNVSKKKNKPVKISNSFLNRRNR